MHAQARMFVCPCRHYADQESNNNLTGRKGHAFECFNAAHA